MVERKTTLLFMLFLLEKKKVIEPIEKRYTKLFAAETFLTYST